MKMRFPGFASVRGRLFAATLLSSLVALLVAGGGLFLFDLHTHRTASVADLAVEAKIVGNGTSAALQFDDAAVAARNLGFLAARSNIRGAAIYDARGKVFATYVREGVAARWPAIGPRPEGATVSWDRVELLHRIRAGGEAIGTVYLEADLEMGKRIGSYAAIALAVTVIALAVALATAALLQAGITRPITQISDLAHQVVERRDYGVRATRTTSDELGRLVDAFNEMLSEIQARTAALESSRDEIARLNAGLEQRVRERTAQLEESNARLKNADLEKSRFLSTMSHEIRTPMNGVLGMLELLTLKDLDPEHKATVAIVRESGRSLLRIIDDILDFSKIEAGKLEVRPEAASVARIVAAVAGIYSGNASSKGLTLRAHVDERISPAVRVDPVRLQQILNNLVSNAIKFTARGFVELRAELVARRDQVDVVRFDVVDTGIGMSREVQARLFEPFSQAGGDVSRALGGTGLGLSIARRLAVLLGGSLHVASESGKGSTMSLELPMPVADPASVPESEAAAGELARSITTRRAAPAVEEAEREGSLVLVVDDHPVNRLLLMQQVTVLGYAAEAAANGREALAKWSSGRFRLVITDCNMPEMDGYSLAGAIRESERDGGVARTAIIACTANALQGEAEKCLAAGMDDYIAKPVDLTRLLARLDTWLPLPQGALPVDASVLAESAVRGAEMRREAFARFQESNEADVGSLLGAIERRDTRQVTQAAHRIRGASRSLGAKPLAEVCQRIEVAARSKDWTAIIANRDALVREVGRLNAFLKAER
jgi:signal transduction histidine kinase/CheY-like chemotaxis protein/HPt (histidine-containing phosphotransfer) domain-containing protein